MKFTGKDTANVTLLSLWLAVGGQAVAATSGSHYSMGTEGVEAATPPPPGVHYRMYNSWYSADTLTGDDGQTKPVDFELDAYAQVHRLIHVTDTKIFGAHYTYNVLVPVIKKQFAMGEALDVSSDFELGDIFIEPIALAWYGEQLDGILALSAILPTGSYSADKPESVGLGYWSGMLTAGATYFFDANRSISFSTLSRTLFHGKQDDTDVRPGAEFILEGGVGMTLPVTSQWLVRPGINYAASWQITDDSKDGPGTLKSERKRSFGAGAELNVMYLPWLLQANLRYLNEFGAEHTSEGDTITLTFTKSF
ncbi:SphA family protein [Ferrimonas balearica]|uniref:SphA family protein n=1 Tax=Ferrimonas balearica TaxID=44012 RepID=UPI001FEE9BC9|nr:transporter [Ferrimonas balearica]